MKGGSAAGCVVVVCALSSTTVTHAAAPVSSSTASSSSAAASPAPARAALLGVVGPGATALRARVRDRLTTTMVSSTTTLLDDETLRLRLRGPMGAPLELATVRAQLRDADEASRRADHERAVGLLEGAIAALEVDRDFSLEKQELLEQARLACAQRLVGLAGPDETGKSETKNGQRARELLVAVLRSNPTFSLDAKRYPPKMRALLALATDDVKQRGMGSLRVRSTDPGAVVRVDGRQLGATPLVLHEGLAAGRFRLWLEAGPLRSFTRVVDVVAGGDVPHEVTVEVDVAFEASLLSDDVGVRPARPFSSTDWRRVAGVLDVDVVDLVGVEHVTSTATSSTAMVDDVVWAAVVDGHTGAVVRGVRVPIAKATAGNDGAATDVDVDDVDARLVALFQGAPGDDGFVAPVDVFAPPVSSSTTSAAGDVDDGFPWLAVGVGLGVGVAAAVTAGLVLQATQTTTETFSVTIAEPTK